MKKFFSVLLALCMIAALCPAAWAARDDQAQQFTKVAVWGEHVYYATGYCLTRCSLAQISGTRDDFAESTIMLDEEILGLAPWEDGLYIITGTRVYKLDIRAESTDIEEYPWFYDVHYFEFADGELNARTLIREAMNGWARLSVIFDGSLDECTWEEAYLCGDTVYLFGKIYSAQTVLVIEDGKIIERFSPYYYSEGSAINKFQHLGQGLLFGGNQTIYYSFADIDKDNDDPSFEDHAFRIIDATDPELGSGPMLSQYSTVTVDDTVFFYGPTGSAYVYDVDKDEIEAMEEEIPHLTGYSDVFTWDGKIYYLAQEQKSFACYDPKTGESVLLDGTLPVDSGTRFISSSACVHEGMLYWVPDYETGLLRVDLDTGETQVDQGPFLAYMVDAALQYIRYEGEYDPWYISANYIADGDIGILVYDYSRMFSGRRNGYDIDVDTMTGEDECGNKVDFNVILDK